MLEFTLGRTTLDIAEGDISSERVDAVVNAANDELWMGAGVAGALKRRGGAEIETEAMAQGPVTPGNCVVTGGGRLAARYVVHAVVMAQDLRTSPDLIDRATRNALNAAADRGLASIALPALGTGVGGFPIDQCARIMIAAVRGHAESEHPVPRVRNILYGRPAFDAFARAASDILGAPPGGGSHRPGQS